MQNATIKTRFIYAGHLLEGTVFGDDEYHLELKSLGAVPLFEDGESLGIYPAYFAESEANLILTENYNPKETYDTLEKVVAGTEEAIAKLVSQNVFGLVR